MVRAVSALFEIPPQIGNSVPLRVPPPASFANACCRLAISVVPSIKILHSNSSALKPVIRYNAE